MSGHSKWAKIHRKKGLVDASRSKVFAKISKEIMIAARGTNGDPNDNPGLRVVVEKARSNNMPKDNIQKAIDKATKSVDDMHFEEMRYEGYGPAGSAFIVDCLTDNKNRTASEVRAAFNKHGGNLGTSGSVSFMFKRKGVLDFKYDGDFDDIMLKAIDAGALDYEKEEGITTVYTEPDKLLEVKDLLINEGISDFEVSELQFVPDTLLSLSEEDTEKVLKLQDALEDIDDVSDVYSNI